MMQLHIRTAYLRSSLILSILIWSNLCWGQTSFSVDTTYKYTKHEANDLVFYMNIPIHNLSGQDLKMGFERSILYLSPAWQTNVQCVDSFYAPHRDTGTFWLPKDFTFNSLIACYFYPNKTIGSAMVEVKIFNYLDPGDSVTLTFGGETFIAAGISKDGEPPPYSIIRAGTDILIKATDRVPKLLEVYDLSGRLLFKQPWPTGVNTIVCTPPAGVTGLAIGRIHTENGQMSVTKWVW